MNRIIGVLALSGLLIIPSAGFAGEHERELTSGTILLIEALEQDREFEAQRPSRGMTRGQVEQRFGEPESRHDPVGDPPITRWEYEDFVVYFEHDHVIRAVTRR
ncbi:hypothetical protein DFR31_0291 [Alkalispirillum mobile]|uniref:Uncharacterized protein n=1 Tax=Alkalispirillum mobile TaxID=85925 RepID=A0A498C3Z1_9GAMM|nr:hypothetical protein [Alkalispirillum mobile]RLK50395.1 hypothetical protein DFR31_0291 [Alkalispirillum mobile]